MNMIIDVRTPAEFESGHLPEAVNIPVSDIDTVPIKAGKKEEITVTCYSGSRAQIAREILQSRGFTNVKLHNGTGALR